MTPVITGRVRSASGKPIPNATVAFESAPGATPDIAALTDADGRFTLGTVGEGPYRLAAHADGYTPGRAAITVTNEPVTVELSLHPRP
ncbi:carboxypeptidase-like regulatory domain-containing protein [Actinophytocola sp.]|jgi:hypothetical protein|uniref:carboxypeptidase-like regulatory domain-containing protein n=1 Tax=Actinophytocola sp. TaxID=1872138 RepID=UPI002EDB88E7